MPEPDRADLVERKACEGGCGGYFWRRVPATAREGEKMCKPCLAKMPQEVSRGNCSRYEGKDVRGSSLGPSLRRVC
jgi:hypothetical protein